jgi:nitrite reductase (NADH) small subunit
LTNWIEIAKLDDVPRLGARVLETATVRIAVFRTAADQVFALKDECPHRKGPLSQGIVHDTTVTCPLHNWKIDLTSGQAKAPDEGCAQSFAVKVEDGRIFLGMLAQDAAA